MARSRGKSQNLRLGKYLTFLVLFLHAFQSLASPFDLNYSGRLVDDKGKPITRALNLSVKFFDNALNGQQKISPLNFLGVVPNAAPQGSAFALSKKVRIDKNELVSAQDQYYQVMPYFILYYPRKGKKTVDWQLGITAAQKTVLDLFANEPREFDASLLMEPAFKAIENGKDFLAEMLRRKVLVV